MISSLTHGLFRNIFFKVLKVSQISVADFQVSSIVVEECILYDFNPLNLFGFDLSLTLLMLRCLCVLRKMCILLFGKVFKRQGRKGKIYPFECRVPKNSKEI